MTDIIWRFTGDFMAPDLVCRIVRYLQVQEKTNVFPDALLCNYAYALKLQY